MRLCDKCDCKSWAKLCPACRAAFQHDGDSWSDNSEWAQTVRTTYFAAQRVKRQRMRERTMAPDTLRELGAA